MCTVFEGGLTNRENVWERSVHIKVSHILVVVVALLIFGLGMLAGSSLNTGMAVFSPGDKEAPCQQYCTLFEGISYSHVEGGECFCSREQLIPDLPGNRTITYTEVFSVGIIRDLEMQEGISDDVMQAILQQQAQSQPPAGQAPAGAESQPEFQEMKSQNFSVTGGFVTGGGEQ